MRLRHIPDEYRCRECVRRVTEYPHHCPVHDVACDHCDHRMAGTARQVMDAAEAHSRQCPGLLRPLEVEGARVNTTATSDLSTEQASDWGRMEPTETAPVSAGNTPEGLAPQPNAPEGGWHQ